MPLEQIKTQVLLLHSEQSTLDNLSAGFNDRYTVHCATSGTEALNTLGETPIHVIVCAQKLPGMSGVEALREAKKRSPETIGILLAGDGEEGLEALVGDKEVFQIVRGSVTATDLTHMIDNATQQVRLLALAESANDTAANVDEPMAEHIVMETSENGSTIISDGTGSLPTLDPQRVSAAVSAGAGAVEILVLTKDEEFLTTIKESSRGMHKVRYANTLAQAEEAITGNKIGVAVVDAAMVGPNVEKLTVHLRKKSPRLVSIVAGRRDDGEMLMDLINRGKVYRFLMKPVSPGRARLAVEASVKHHLEAPDAAFVKSGGAPAQQATNAPTPTAATKPAPTPKLAAVAKPTAKAPPQAKPMQASTPASKVTATYGDPLSAPFDDTESSFGQTMTGLVAKVSKPFSAKDDVVRADPGIGSSLDINGGTDSDGSIFENPKALGLAAVVAIAFVAAGFLLFTGSDDDLSESSAADSSVSVTEADPSFDSAADVDSAVLPAADIEQELALAETALLEGRTDEASAALQRVELADPNNSRLPFLTAQLTQAQLRDYLDDARAAIRESRLEEASIALNGARALAVTDATEIETVAAELSDARSAQRADDVLIQAAERLEQGQLIAPPNDNARYFYELVLSSDPENTTAQQGLTVVASKLVLQARTEIDRGRFNQAEGLLDDAKRLDPSSNELAAATQAITDARKRQAAAAEQQAAEKRAAAEQQAAIEAAASEAADATGETGAIEENVAAEDSAAGDTESAEVSDGAETTVADAGTDSADAATDVAAADTGEPTGTERFAATANSTDNGSALADNDPVDSAPVNFDAPIAISSLTRTKYVAPKYPRSAERRSQGGWVDLVFTVAMDGSTKNIEVRDSDPGDVFINSAVKAVGRWEFQPIIENGRLVEKRAGVRMLFAIE